MPVTPIDPAVEDMRTLVGYINDRMEELDQPTPARRVQVAVPPDRNDSGKTVLLDLQSILFDLIGNTATTITVDSDAIFGGETWDALTGGGNITLHKHDIYGELAQDETITGDWTFRDSLDVIGVAANVNTTLTVDSQGASTHGDLLIRGAGEAGSSYYSSIQLWSNEATPLAWRFAHEEVTGSNLLYLGDWNGSAWNAAVFSFTNAGEFIASTITLGGATLDSTEWGFLDGIDQALKTSDTASFLRLGLNTTTVPHAGIGTAATRLALDSGDIQLTHVTDNWPVMQMVVSGHDDVSISFDSYYDDLNGPASWRSSDAGSNFIIYKITDQLQFRTDSGIAAGSDLTWDTMAYFTTAGDFVMTGTNQVQFNASTEYANSGAAGYLDLHAATTVRVYGADDDTADFQVFSGATEMLQIRRASAGSPTLTRIMVPEELHIYAKGTLCMRFDNADNRMDRPLLFNSYYKMLDNQAAGFGTGSGAVSSYDATIKWNGSVLVIDPDALSEGSGKLYVGATADDDIVAANFMATTAGTETMFSSGAGILDFSAATQVQTTSPFYVGDVQIAQEVSTQTIEIGTEAEIGQWPANAAYAMFGNADLDHSVAGNYALMQENDGDTYLNAASGKNIFVRINNATIATVDSDSILMAGAYPVEFRDNGLLVYSRVADELDIVTDGTIRVGAATVNYSEFAADGDLTFVGTAGLPLAEIYVRDQAAETAIATAGTYVQFLFFDTDGLSNNCTPDHTNDHITIVKAGWYLVTVSLHVESVAAGGADDFGFEVRKNNGTVIFNNLHAHRRMAGGGGDVGSVSMSGFIDVAATDTIEVWTTNEDGTDNVTISDCTLSVAQVAGT